MGSAKTRVYPVDGIKLACWVVIVWEQSALGTFATMASAAVKTVGFVLFSLHATTIMNVSMTEKSRKARRTRAGMRYWWKPGGLYDKTTR
jgi:hypothetical protein